MQRLGNGLGGRPQFSSVDRAYFSINLPLKPCIKDNVHNIDFVNFLDGKFLYLVNFHNYVAFLVYLKHRRAKFVDSLVLQWILLAIWHDGKYKIIKTIVISSSEWIFIGPLPILCCYADYITLITCIKYLLWIWPFCRSRYTLI